MRVRVGTFSFGFGLIGHFDWELGVEVNLYGKDNNYVGINLIKLWVGVYW